MTTKITKCTNKTHWTIHAKIEQTRHMGQEDQLEQEEQTYQTKHIQKIEHIGQQEQTKHIEQMGGKTKLNKDDKHNKLY